MHAFSRLSAFVLVCCGFSAAAQARVWTDTTGKYTVDADLFAFNDEQVIVQRKDGHLGMYQIKDLSEEDRKYLESEEALEQSDNNLSTEQTWLMKDGFRLVGHVVDYARKKVVMQRRRAKSYINDRQYKTLPEMYQLIIRESLEELAGLEDVDDEKLQHWFVTKAFEPQTFEIEGVVIELKDGNEYIVPFFLFSDESLAILKGGWEEWKASHDSNDYDAQKDESFRLQSAAAAMHQEQAINREIAVANLGMNAINAGITSMWEVTLYPNPSVGNTFPPRWVVVTGRNSEQAKYNALQQNPGFLPGPIRKVSRGR